MDFYSAYPMTPASSLIDVIVTKIAEDEKQMITDDNFQKSTEKIDGIVATIMALDRAIRCGNDTGESVYDTRGLLVF